MILFIYQLRWYIAATPHDEFFSGIIIVFSKVPSCKQFFRFFFGANNYYKLIKL